MTKIIGIVGHPSPDGNFIGIGAAYANYVQSLGYEYKIISPTNDYVDETIDLLMLPGGPDVNPKRYKQKPHPRTGKSCVHRELFDTEVLPLYIEKEISIFSICRGMQSISVHFGASLDQHINTKVHDTNKEDRTEIVHPIAYIKNKYIHIGYTNSIHHQVVSHKRFPHKQLKIIAKSIEFDQIDEKDINVVFNNPTSRNLIEGVCHKDLNIAGVQYHPEELLEDDLANSLIHTLINKQHPIKDGMIETKKSKLIV